MKCPYCDTKQSFWKSAKICPNCNKEYKPKIKFWKFFLIMVSVQFSTNMILFFVFGIRAGAILKALIAGISAGMAVTYSTIAEAMNKTKDVQSITDDF